MKSFKAKARWGFIVNMQEEIKEMKSENGSESEQGVEERVFRGKRNAICFRI